MAGETNYLTVDYVCAKLDQAFVLALFDAVDVAALATNAGFLNTCYDASAVISLAISSAGYVAPTTATATTPTQKYINLAALGEMVMQAYPKARKRVRMPEGYEQHGIEATAMMVARKEIMAGEMDLDLPLANIEGALGGISATSTSDSPTLFHRSDFQ